MEIQVTLKTVDYRGDHTAEVSIAHSVAPNETVEQLVKRLLTNRPVKSTYGETKGKILRPIKSESHIELKICIPSDQRMEEGRANFVVEEAPTEEEVKHLKINETLFL